MTGGQWRCDIGLLPILLPCTISTPSDWVLAAGWWNHISVCLPTSSCHHPITMIRVYGYLSHRDSYWTPNSKMLIEYSITHPPSGTISSIVLKGVLLYQYFAIWGLEIELPLWFVPQGVSSVDNINDLSNYWIASDLTQSNGWCQLSGRIKLLYH